MVARTQQWLTFSSETLDRLYEAVETDDIVDEHVELPGDVVLEGNESVLFSCYSLCLQFWEEGVSRTQLLKYADKLLAGVPLSDDEKRDYKKMRGCYKHLRFAVRLYSRNHRSFKLFNYTTHILGELQDAFRHQQTDDIQRYGKRLKLLLSRPLWSLIEHRMRHVRLDTPEGFHNYRQHRLCSFKKGSDKAEVSGHEFHDMRKIIGQQVSYYDTLRSIDPDNTSAYKMSRFLSAINGLMGDRHDEMVEDAMNNTRPYGSPEIISSDTRWRIDAFLERFLK
ncbi:hypothetical protein LMG33818_002171 [Halomonadaceae bacterium LMG 33818]|uniref:hypothetical protein n=1 Tax=Cernens ardua TaxID=3402176 RepID=UPI003EDB9A7C